MAPIKNTVEFEGRTWGDVPCAVIFILVFVTHVCGGFYLLASKNSSLDVNDGYTYSDAFQKEIDECNEDPSRRLQIIAGQNAKIWTIFEQYPQIPSVTILFVVALGVGWIFLLQHCSKPIVWATALIKIAVIAGAGVAALDISTEHAIVCFACAGIWGFLTFLARAKITKAAEHLELACIALRAEYGAFGAVGIVKTIYLVYLAFYCIVVINASFVQEIDPTGASGCFPVTASYVSSMVNFISFGMVWTTYFTNSVKTQITAMSVASWYFDMKENRPERPALSALKTAFTTSCGTLAFGALVTTIVERILAAGRSRTSWLTPLGCVLKIVLMCLKTLIETLTKFTILVHALTGLPFFASAKSTFGVLKRHFVGAVVTDQVGSNVLRLGAYVFSLAVGFSVWAWVDNVKGWNTLTASGWENLGGSFLFYIFLVLYLYLTYNPMMTIIIVSIASEWLTDEKSAFLTALFCSAVANIILTYVADVILDAMDTIFLCYAIAKDNNQKVEGRDNMYILLEAMPDVVKDPEPHPEAMQIVGGSTAV